MTQQESAHRAEIVHVEPQALVVSRRAILSRELLKEEAEQRKLLGEYVKQEMKDGTDFGRIPGTDKPTLLKPGAEKLVALFHCSPEFTLVQEQCATDFDKGFFKYTFRCVIRGPGGAVLAEGYGSANSREGRYRWRTANRRCLTCGKDAIIQGKAEYGGGWVCFKKKGGCGQKYAADDQAIMSQPLGRVENEDIADLDNTILKMAKKRAHVDGAIALARCSDMFTQDVEDLGYHGGESERPANSEDGAAGSDASQAHLTGTESGQALEGKGQRKSKKTAEEPPRETPPAPKPAASGPTVGFGPYKKALIADVSDDGINESIDFAEAKLLAEPTAEWALAMSRQLNLLKAEKARRAAGRAS
jgi:hypothetical protein